MVFTWACTAPRVRQKNLPGRVILYLDFPVNNEIQGI